MLGSLSAPFAEFIELDFFDNKFFVLAGPVIYALASTADKFYKSFLGHGTILI